MIDYARMKKSHPKLKAALTRAQKKGFVAVKEACIKAVTEWNAIGAWPDNWSLWQRTLDDAACKERVNTVSLDTLGPDFPSTDDAWNWRDRY
jgi:hypothetical protein